MWIASKHGFYSIVLKEGGLHVRARKRGDLVNLCAVAHITSNQIIATPDGDYAYRLIFKRPRHAKEIERIWMALADSVSYPNFKAIISATPHQREKLPAYADFWATMLWCYAGQNTMKKI